MGRDGTERASAKTAAVDVDGVLYHLVCRDGAALLVLGMWQAGIRQVEGGINLLGGHRRLGRIDEDEAVAVALHEGGADYFVALLLDDVVVLCLGVLTFEAFLERVELNNSTSRTSNTRNTSVTSDIGYLWQGIAGFDAFALVEELGYLESGAFAHQTKYKFKW